MQLGLGSLQLSHNFFTDKHAIYKANVEMDIQLSS